MEMKSDDLPEFFKVYITQHSSNQMQIPNDFLVYMGKSKSGLAELSGPNGVTWQVKLVGDGNDLYFTDGWQAFVKENSIRDGDFLFFKFHGDMKFSVVIYDETLCEKQITSNKRIQAEDISTLEAKEKQNGIRTNVRTSQPEEPLFPVKGEADEQNDTAVRPCFQKCITEPNKKINIPMAFVRENSLSYKSYEKMVLWSGGNSSWKVSVLSYHSKISLSSGWPAFARENRISAGDTCKFELLDRLEMKVHVERHENEIKPEKINVAAFKSKKPLRVSHHVLRSGSQVVPKVETATARTVPSPLKRSFVLHMKKHHVKEKYIVCIPSQFIIENSLSYLSGETMVLRTNKDSSWPVRIIKTEGKHRCFYSLSKGWAAFVKGNNIEEGDVCKFELVKRLEMKVHRVPHSK